MSTSTIQAHDVPKPPSRLKHLLTVALVALILMGSAWQVEFSFSQLWAGIPNIGDLLVQMWPPNAAYAAEVMAPILETVRMALLGTTFGAILALPIALLSARNIFATGWITLPARMVMNFIRTMPDLLLAALFVAIFGIGPVSGVFALTFFSLGIISKLIYETIESVDRAPLEAMTAVGANKIVWITFGVFPQIAASFLSYTLYSLEVNVRAAAILGLVGAGGIGLYYESTLGFFQYGRVATIILLTLLVVMLIDYLSTKGRERLA
ncbi:phosphonate ABC transporter, permease protein PhnE [Marinococcus halotolerans]|uniref:phosphonate ABC transporter, permease protein PhnE n=1 Tax=Marinococcus halotolerans TaxID=301092 RepID=UPI0003B3DE60|nr:phosphonate ABC transporter, permease protein PhnE [Marinococcus halotolerans]